MQAGGIWLTGASSRLPRLGGGGAAARDRQAMVYPTLAGINDVAHPEWRASTMGVYRFRRDLGYAIGSLISGIMADLLGMWAAIQVVPALTLISGLQVAIRMQETLDSKRFVLSAPVHD